MKLSRWIISRVTAIMASVSAVLAKVCRWIIGNATAAAAIANASLVLINLAGLFVVVSQLRQINQQNDYLERTLRQTYRPLGVARYSADSSISQIVAFVASPVKGRFSFELDPILTNKGKGILIYLGWLDYLSTKEINFREELLNSDLSDLRFDNTPSYARTASLLPGESVPLAVTRVDVPKERRYFHYTLFLYKDQDDGLYDTELLDVLSLKEGAGAADGSPPQLEKERSLSRPRYRYYTQDERRRLIARIKKFKHPLADYIEME